MIAEDTNCIDVLTPVQRATKALLAFRHLRHYVEGQEATFEAACAKMNGTFDEYTYHETYGFNAFCSGVARPS